jgi:hypothetical protein
MSNKIFNSCFKFVFLTKKFKERWPCITFVKLFLNTMIRNIKIHNILDLLEFQNVWNLINIFITKNYENFHFSVSYDFSKFNGFKKIRV